MLAEKYRRNSIGLNRDDGLKCFKNIGRPRA